MNNIQLLLLRVFLFAIALGMISSVEIANAKDQMISVKVRNPDNKGVIATIQVPIEKNWQDVAETDSNGDRKFSFNCASGIKLRARPREKAKYTMSPESLCVVNQEIVLWVQPIDQIFTSWADELLLQIESSNDSVVFGKLPINLKTALGSADYGIAAQAYLEISQAGQVNQLTWLNQSRLKVLANQSMAAQLGFNPTKTVVGNTGDIMYLDPEYQKAVMAIQEEAGLIATGSVDTETIRVVTGVPRTKLIYEQLMPQKF